MSISPVKKCFGNSVYKQVEKKPNKFWRETTNILGKKDAVTFLGMLVNRSTWMNDPTARRLVNNGIKFFERKELSSPLQAKVRNMKTTCKIKDAHDKERLLELLSRVKHDKEKVKFLETMIKQKSWDQDAGHRSAIDTAKEMLESRPLKASVKKKLSKVEALDKALALYATRVHENITISSHPTLFTAKILNRKTSKRLKEVCKAWDEKAKQKRDIAEAAVARLDDEKQSMAMDLQSIVNGIKDCIPKKPNKTDDALYIAYDLTGKVHAIALVDLSKRHTNEIDLLTANPDNVVVLGNEDNPVRGAGSAVITHIARDVFNSKQFARKKLKLSPLPSAIPFYEKLGFSLSKKEKMVMDKEAMQRLLFAKPETHIIQDKEPKTKSIIA